MSDTRQTFMDRALGGHVLHFDLETELDDEVAAWHQSDSDVELSEWLGMDPSEYAFFVERPGDVPMLLKARRYGLSLSTLSRLREQSGISIAARAAGGLSSEQIEDLLTWLRRRGRLVGE